MRQQIGLFFIALIALSGVASMNDDIAYLKSIKSTVFGKTLVESIQIELRSGSEADSVDRILALLKQIKHVTDQDRKADKAKYTSWKAKTDAKVAQLKVRVSKLSKAIKADYQRIKVNNHVIAQSKKALKKEQKSLKSDKRNLAKNLKTQKETTDAYNIAYAKISAQITAIAYAKSLLIRMLHGSFVETSQQEFVELSGSLQNLKFNHEKYEGFISTLSTMLVEVERVHGVSQAKKIIKILADLYKQLVKAAADMTAVYKRRMTDLTLVQERIQVSINVHKAEIAHLETIIGQKNEANVAAGQRIKSNGERKQEAITESKDLVQQLKHQAAQYERRQRERNAQDLIIEKVVFIFQSKLTNEVRSSVKVL